nr:endo-1,4-beta-xylanase [uncultured bacterium]
MNEWEKELMGLCEIYKDYFPIGAAVSARRIKRYESLLKKHFNSVTPENALKMINVYKGPDKYNFEEMDQIVRFANDNNMLLRGHVLIWYSQVAESFFENDNGEMVSREMLLTRMKEYIRKVVGRYKKDIYCWDVVNEAIDDNDNIYLRDTQWKKIIGDDYIEQAFLIAHEMAPEASLFYNDYNYVIKNKREKIYKLIKSLKGRDIPIHGIGIQGHWGLYYPDVTEIKRTLELFADLDLKIQLTEMDMSMFEWGDNRRDMKQPSGEMLKIQAEKYGKIFEILREYAEVISGVTFWGVADDYTWLDDFPVEGRKDWPLLFDSELKPKPSLDAITRFSSIR